MADFAGYTVEDLGRAFKQKYPGKYDNYTDAEVGRAMKTKSPDAYGAFTDVADKPAADAAKPSKLKSFSQGFNEAAQAQAKGNFTDVGMPPTQDLLPPLDASGHVQMFQPNASTAERLMQLVGLGPLYRLFQQDPARAAGQAATYLPAVGQGAAQMAGAEGAVPNLVPGRNPVTNQPWMPPLNKVIETVTPPGAKSPIHAGLMEAAGYELARRLTGIRFRNPFATGVQGGFYGDSPAQPFVGSPLWDNPPQDLLRQLGLPPEATAGPHSRLPEDFQAEPQAEFPSGRVPGDGTPQPPQPEPPLNYVPGWQRAGIQLPTPEEQPDFRAIPQTEFPSGRVPGNGEPRPPAPEEPFRQVPLWKEVTDLLGIEDTPRGRTPDVEPIRGPLPSGRRVPTEEEIAQRYNSPTAPTPKPDTTATGAGGKPTVQGQLGLERPAGMSDADWAAVQKLPAKDLQGAINRWNNREKAAEAGVKYFNSKNLTPEQIQQMVDASPPETQNQYHRSKELLEHSKAMGRKDPLTQGIMQRILEKMRGAQ